MEMAMKRTLHISRDERVNGTEMGEQCIQFACVTHSRGECIAWAHIETPLRRKSATANNSLLSVCRTTFGHTWLAYMHDRDIDKEEMQKTRTTSWFVSIGVLASFPSFLLFFFFFHFFVVHLQFSSASLEFASELSAISLHYTLTHSHSPGFAIEFCLRISFSTDRMCYSSNYFDAYDAGKTKNVYYFLLLWVVCVWLFLRCLCLLCAPFHMDSFWPLFMSHLAGENDASASAHTQRPQQEKSSFGLICHEVHVLKWDNEVPSL